MRRPIILGGNPYVSDVYKKNAKTLFDDTGGNSGNLAFQYAIASHLSGNVAILPWGSSPDQVRAAGDVIILPLANQLGSHTDLGSAAARLEDFNLPIIGVGLGAQAEAQSVDVNLKEGTLNWLKTLIKLSPTDEPNIGVRGPYTKSQIERLGFENKAIVTGCPSNFINTTGNIADQIAAGFRRKPEHFAIMAGIPFIPKIAKIEQDLADIVTLTGGAYIVQHGLEMLRLARNEFDNISPETLELCRAYIRPQLDLEQFKTWCRQYAFAFYDARAWMDFVTRFDFVVGTRFHGAMFAIQAGIPAGCITHDSRTQEMCETMGIPSCHYSDINGTLTKDNVLDYFKFDPDQYKATRHRLLQRYTKLYRDADVAFNQTLDKLESSYN